MLLRAKYVVPVDRPPLKNGAVRIEGGRIAEVGQARQMTGAPIVDFGDAVLLPGLVNAHTHLEATHLSGVVTPEADFLRWLQRVRDATATPDPARSADGPANSPAAAPAANDPPDRTSFDWASSARDGMRLSLACGVTTVGDITSRPDVVRPVLTHGPLRVLSFGEVIAAGTLRGRLPARLAAALNDAFASECLSVALSPHSPYTLEYDGIAACVDAAARNGLRLCIHLAETADETRFTRQGDGPVRDFLRRVGVWDGQAPCPQLAPVAYAHACGALGERTLAVHCNDVSDEDLKLLAQTRTNVAYCPRTHAAFDHPPHRFRDMLAMGINVCIGTDSLASNPTLSVLDEIRFLHARYPDVPPATLLDMATIRGAQALGWDHRIGGLTPGKSADLTVVPWEPGGPGDPVENVLVSAHVPLASFIRGQRVPRHAVEHG